jgi:hypothetical protein
MTNEEISERFDLPKPEDEEIAESYRTPAEVEQAEEQGGEAGGMGGIFGSDFRHTRELDTPQSVPDNAISVSDPSEIPEGATPYQGDRGGLYYLPAGEDPQIDVPDTPEGIAENTDAEPDEISDFDPESLESGDEVIVQTTAGEREAVEVTAITPTGQMVVEDNQGNQITIGDDGRDESGEIQAIANVGDDGGSIETPESREESVNQIANNYVSGGEDAVDLGDAPDETVQNINEALSEVVDGEGLPEISEIRFDREFLREESSKAKHSPQGLMMLGDFFAEEQDTEALEERNKERVSHRDDVDRMNVGKSQKDTIIHEYGHHMQFQLNDAGMMDEALDVFGVNGNTFLLGTFEQGSKQEAKNVSQYATADPGEKFAESFTAYHKGETDRLTEEQVDFFDRLTEEVSE